MPHRSRGRPRAVLGDGADAFERDLRERLGPGPSVEHARFEAFFAPVPS